MNKFQTINNQELATVSGGGIGTWIKWGISIADQAWNFGCGIYDGLRGK